MRLLRLRCSLSPPTGRKALSAPRRERRCCCWTRGFASLGGIRAAALLLARLHEPQPLRGGVCFLGSAKYCWALHRGLHHRFSCMLVATIPCTLCFPATSALWHHFRLERAEGRYDGSAGRRRGFWRPLSPPLTERKKGQTDAARAKNNGCPSLPKTRGLGTGGGCRRRSSCPRRLPSRRRIMDFPGHFEQIFQQLNYQRLHGQLCDCVIVVGNRHFKAHRSVLAACSTHFRALFTVAEGDQTMNMIQLDSEVVTAEAFAALIDMMYTSTLMLGESNVMDVLLAASHLHLNSVVKACKHYLTTRTLPMSPPSDRVQEQNARMQRSFMLQQLGLSIVSSALNSTQSTEEQTNSMSSSIRSNIEQRSAFPIRRLHKRKQSSEERARQRIRPTIDDSMMSDVTPESAQAVVHSRDEFFSPDSLKIVDNSKPDGVTDNQEDNTLMFDQSFGAQEDAQVPSQSDNGGGNISQMSMASQATQVETSFDQDSASQKSKFQCENPEVGLSDKEHMRVVVKSEPLSSPEPQDEVSDVTSQAEGSESVEVEGGGVSAEKIELSPESSDRSFSDPQSSTDRVGDIHIMEVANNLEHKSTFSISNFLNKTRASSFGAGQNEDNIPNTTSDCRMDGDASYLMGPESGPANGHSSATVSHVENPFNDSADSHFVRPMQDVMGLPCVQTSGYRAGEPFGMDFPRSGLGLHSLSRAVMSSSRGGATSFPGYRRIAPKMPVVTSVRSAQIQDNAPNSQLLMNGATSSFENGHPSQAGPPQLTRASADVLSKCKKALSEHNVLVVEGARKYACKICCKTFLTLTDCKKHIRVHTGEKPYACLKCGKRFSQSSHLYKHSKTTCLRWQSSNLPSTLL